MGDVAPPLAELTAHAQTLTSAGDLVAAKAVLTDALDPVDADPQRASPDLADAASLLARILIALGDPHGARLWAGFAHAAGDRLYGPHDERTIAAAALHAAVLHRIGNHGRAAQLYHDLVGELAARDGPDSPRVLAAEADLATAEHAAGQCTAARARLADAWARHRRVYGDATPAGIKMLARLGVMERECGRTAEPQQHLALVQELCARYLPADHPLAVQAAGLVSAPASGRHICGRVERSTGPDPAPGVRSVHIPTTGPPMFSPGVRPVRSDSYRDDPRRDDPGRDDPWGAQQYRPEGAAASAPQSPARAPRSNPPGAPPQPSVPPQRRPPQTGPIPTNPIPTNPIPSGPPQTGAIPSGPIPSGPIPNGPIPSGPIPNGPIPNGQPQTGPIPHGAAQTRPVEVGPAQAEPAPTDPSAAPISQQTGQRPTPPGPRSPSETLPDAEQPAPDDRTTDPNGKVYQQPLYLSDVHQAPGDLTGRHARADTPPPLPGQRAPEVGPDGRQIRIGAVEVPAPTKVAPPRRSPEPFDRPAPRGSWQPLVLVAVLVAGIAVAAAVVVATLPRANGDTTPPSSAGPVASAPAASAAASPSPAASGIDAGPPPSDVRLRDNHDSVSLDWTYPKGAEGPVLISGGRTGQEQRAFQQLPAGTANYVVYGLNEQLDYCFTVAVVYTVDHVAASAPLCTKRK